jgi:hypothetical protein
MIDEGPFKSHTVIAKNEENAKKMIADMLNKTHTISFKPSDFVTSGPIDPNDYYEEMVIN